MNRGYINNDKTKRQCMGVLLSYFQILAIFLVPFLKTDGLLKHSVLKQIYFLYKHRKKELEKWQGFGNKTTELPCTAFLFCHC